ncbi:MAG: reverse transcriptase domain-containing protein, partial [Patescibacteria group bacterium]
MDFERLISLERIFSSWDGFKKGKRSKPDVLDFEFDLENNIFNLQNDLQNQTYRHGPYSTFRICDPKSREISKASVRDRLVHYLVFNELYDLFEEDFIFHSYSSRLGKGTHLAVINLEKALRKASRNYHQPVYALKLDIRKFFSSIPHQKLTEIMKRKIKDKKFLWLLEEIIGSFTKTVMGGG